MYASRMSFEDLSLLQDKFDDMLASGRMLPEDYDARWKDLLSVAGWTQEQYDAETDRRWDYIDTERGSAPRSLSIN